ncbi:MAG TPA: hypothetical protein VFN51_03225 [Candidatus Saccharimonadales bacterium]|nr:hypothetical protein [Candidatus Saccharimonadales bacterium]
MATTKQPTIYAQVVRVTHVYLGPAAERFIDRQVENHLHKPADKITRSDLHSLIDWVRVVVSLLTDDKDIIEEYLWELEKIADPKIKRVRKT